MKIVNIFMCESTLRSILYLLVLILMEFQIIFCSMSGLMIGRYAYMAHVVLTSVFLLALSFRK